MNPSDKDNPIKIMISRVLWNMGYTTRLNVRVTSYEVKQPSGFELTDIDVFGIKVLEEYKLDHALADCSTHGRLSPINRALRLKGLMDLVGATHGYICLEREAPISHREVSHRLGVTLLTPAHLEELNRRYNGRRRASPFLFDAKHLTFVETGISSIPKPFQRLLDYRKAVYWITPHHRNIQQLIALSADVANQIDPKQKFHRALLWDIVGLLTVSILDVCARLFHTLPTNYAEALRTHLAGDYFSLKARSQLLTAIKQLFKKVAKQDLFIQKGFEDAVEKLVLDPPYFNDLLETTLRLNSKIEAARDLLRYVQIRISQTVTEKPKPIKTILEEEHNEVTLKFLDDVRLLFTKATRVPDAAFAAPSSTRSTAQAASRMTKKSQS